MADGTAIRLGLVGAGQWGRICIRALAGIEGVRLAAVASRNPEIRSLTPEACAVYADWPALLAAGGLDGLVIATPPATHAEIAMAALRRGLAVFVEKPLALSVNDAQALDQAAAQLKSRVFFTDHIHLFSPAYRALKRLAQEAGPILSMEGLAGNHGPYRPDTSVLWDWAPHDAAMMIDLMGRAPDTVAARRIERRKVAGGTGETIRIELGFGDCAGGATLGTLTDKVRRFTVTCRDATLVYDDLAAAKLTRDGVPVRLAATPPLTAALTDFADAIRDGRRHVDGLDLGIKVVEILAQAEATL